MGQPRAELGEVVVSARRRPRPRRRQPRSPAREAGGVVRTATSAALQCPRRGRNGVLPDCRQLVSFAEAGSAHRARPSSHGAARDRRGTRRRSRRIHGCRSLDSHSPTAITQRAKPIRRIGGHGRSAVDNERHQFVFGDVAAATARASRSATVPSTTREVPPGPNRWLPRRCVAGQPSERRAGGGSRHRISAPGAAAVGHRQLNRCAAGRRMAYAFAYGIRTERSKINGSPPPAVVVLASALLHGRHAGACDVRTALPVAGRPCDVRQRRDGDRGGAALARTARQAARPASPGRPGLRLSPRSPPRCARWSSARRRRSARSWPSAMSCWHRCGCGSRSTATSPRGIGGSRASASHGPQRDVGVVHHHQPHLDPGVCSSRCTRCRTACLVATKSTSCGWWPASARGWAGPFRCSRCGGG